jgi:hypothetical protein
MRKNCLGPTIYPGAFDNIAVVIDRVCCSRTAEQANRADAAVRWRFGNPCFNPVLSASLAGPLSLGVRHRKETAMSDHEPSTKNPHDLFREIDALCNEIDIAAPNSVHKVETSAIQTVLKDQDARDREKRKSKYSQLVSCRLLDIEIQPFESPRDRASLTVRSTSGSFRESINVAECFDLIEFLLAHDFVTLSTGKVRRDRKPREDEDRVFTWFILGKTDSPHPHKIKEG